MHFFLCATVVSGAEKVLDTQFGWKGILLLGYGVTALGCEKSLCTWHKNKRCSLVLANEKQGNYGK